MGDIKVGKEVRGYSQFFEYYGYYDFYGIGGFGIRVIQDFSVGFRSKGNNVIFLGIVSVYQIEFYCYRINGVKILRVQEI